MSPAYRQILSQARLCARELGVHAPVRVLVVDDDAAWSDQLAKWLRRSDRGAFEVDCTDMEHAAARIREQEHDVYVLDATAGRVGGLEVVQSLHEEGVHFPFVVLAAEGARHREAMSADCMGYFQRSVSGDDLAVSLLDAVKNYTTRCIFGCSREPVAA